MENYQKYKIVLSKEEFFNGWDKYQLENMVSGIKDYVYSTYVLRCAVFQRDEFKCQNKHCTSPESPLTMHHIKHKRNGGKDTLRNCITICNACHTRFNRFKGVLTFWGHTYKLHKKNEISWKQIKKKNKKYRRELKYEGIGGITISSELFLLLMKFLEISYEEVDEYLDVEEIF